MNTYEMLLDLRTNIGEIDDGTTSHWRDRELLRKLNWAQRKVYALLVQTDDSWLIKKSSALTPSSGIISLPSDCSKPMYMEEVSSGKPVNIIGSVGERLLSRVSAQALTDGIIDAYPLGNTLEVNQEDYSEQVYLWYIPRPMDLHTGTAAAGGANSLTLAASLGHSIVNDYYNGQEIEVVSGTGVGKYTITDYVGTTRVCTAAGTFGADSVYGMLSILPVETHDLIVLEATLMSLAKPGSLTEQDSEVLAVFRDMLKTERSNVEEWAENRLALNRHVRTTEFF